MKEISRGREIFDSPSHPLVIIFSFIIALFLVFIYLLVLFLIKSKKPSRHKQHVGAREVQAGALAREVAVCCGGRKRTLRLVPKQLLCGRATTSYCNISRYVLLVRAQEGGKCLRKFYFVIQI